MQLSTCVKWRHVRHVIAAKTINELLPFMSGTVTYTYQLSKEDRIFIVQNFAVHMVALESCRRHLGDMG